jgi:uncharacterized protein
MKSGSLRQGHERMFVLMFEEGDELVSMLENFARKHKISGGQITGMGSLGDVTLGAFDWKNKRYKKTVEIRQQVQVLSLGGDIAQDKGRPRIVCHAVVAKQGGSVYGGHLMHAHVRPLLEVVIIEASQLYQRTYNHDSGLALLRPEPQIIARRKIS